MNIPAERAVAHFDTHPCAPMTLVYGSETLLNIEAVQAWRCRAKKDGYSELQRIDADSGFQWANLRTEFDSLSLFAAQRGIELYSDIAKLSESAVNALKRLATYKAEHIRLLLHIPNLERPHHAGWYKTLFHEMDNCAIQSQRLYPNAFQKQIEQRLIIAKLRLDEDAKQRLFEYCQGNLLAVQQAIDRLCIHPAHQQIIDSQILGELLSDVSQFGVFAFSDALLNARWLEAYKIINKLREEDATLTTFITWLIQRDMSILLQLHTLPVAQHKEVFNQYRLRNTYQRKRYQLAVKLIPISLTRNLLKLCAKLDRLDKGAEGGDYWLTLSQYFILLAQYRQGNR